MGNPSDPCHTATSRMTRLCLKLQPKLRTQSIQASSVLAIPNLVNINLVSNPKPRCIVEVHDRRLRCGRQLVLKASCLMKQEILQPQRPYNIIIVLVHILLPFVSFGTGGLMFIQMVIATTMFPITIITTRVIVAMLLLPPRG